MYQLKLDRAVLANITTDELRRVHNADGSGFADDAKLKHVGTVKLSAIYTAPRVFQPRNEAEYPHEVSGAIERLAVTIKRGAKLDRILVFPVQGKRLAIDGHLRLRAYEKAGLGGDTPVRVQHVLSLDEALLLSASANSKDKLRLTGNAKSERCWFLMKENEGRKAWTLAQIAAACDRSLRLCKFMARVLRTNEEEFDFDPRDEASWKAVLAKRNGDDGEMWTEEEVHELILQHAHNWRKAGKLPVLQPEAAAQGLYKAYERVAQEVAEMLSGSEE